MVLIRREAPRQDLNINLAFHAPLCAKVPIEMHHNYGYCIKMCIGSNSLALVFKPMNSTRLTRTTASAKFSIPLHCFHMLLLLSN